jgi:hypothetical protein
MSASTTVPAVSASHTGLRPENPIEPLLLALYRRASPEKKLAVVTRLNATLLGLKEAQLAATRPDWTTSQRRTELRRWWFSARD